MCHEICHLPTWQVIHKLFSWSPDNQLLILLTIRDSFTNAYASYQLYSEFLQSAPGSVRKNQLPLLLLEAGSQIGSLTFHSMLAPFRCETGFLARGVEASSSEIATICLFAVFLINLCYSRLATLASSCCPWGLEAVSFLHQMHTYPI